MRISSALSASCLISSALAATSAQWATRSIYQLFTDRFALADGSAPPCNVGERLYCGGTWAGITAKLPYIQAMGFDAIWISPVAQNFGVLSQYGQAYHGYWTQNINNLNTNFGTAADLKNLVSAVHAAGMYIMVDLTVNSMAYPGSHLSVDYTTFASPFNAKGAYHQFCWIDYTNATSILECWLGDDNVALVDVYTEDTGIRSTYNTWIKNLVSTYNLDGLRIDALKSVEVGFFPGFVQSAGIFAIGENYQADPTMCCAYQPSVPGLLNFPLYYGLFYAFNATGGGIANLANLIAQNAGNCSVNLMGNFVENHDLPRYAGITSDQHQRINALAFTFVMDGMPVVYYGQEQAFTGLQDPYNREALWTSKYDETNPYFTTIATLNAVRKNAIAMDPTFTTTKNTTVLYHDVDYIVLKKGDLLSCLFNDGIYGSNATMHLPTTGYAANTQLIEVLTQNQTSTDSSGGLTFKRASGAPLIFYPYSKWNSSIPKPNMNIEIDTRTTATTTMTTTYVYPTAKAASSEGQVKASVSLKMLGIGLSLGAVAVTAVIFS